MPNFSLNYSELDSSMKQVEQKTFKFAEVKDKLTKVAFDVFKLEGYPDELWQVQNADDGEYIVARYEMDEPAEKTAALWSTIFNKQGELNIFYKGYPITKVALKTNTQSIQSILPKKLASDKILVSAMLNSLSQDDKIRIHKLFPELG